MAAGTYAVALRFSKPFRGLAAVRGVRQSQQRNVPGHLGSTGRESRVLSSKNRAQAIVV